jgi:hypothetical protein
MTPFQEKPLMEQGFFRRLFGKPVPENAYIALENLLAHNNWSNLHEGHVSDILRSHGLKRFDHARAIEIYKKAFAKFVEDETITDAETENLARLRDLLGIKNSDVDEIERQFVHPIYDKTVTDVLADQTVNADERERLDRLRKALRIDEEKAAAMYGARAKEILQSRFSEMVRDKRVSDAEIETFEKSAEALGARIELDYSAREQVERFRTFWRIENGIFPEVDAPINLQRGEKCHFSTAATWHENRTVTKAVRYGGPAVSIRIMKGLYYRAGSYNVQRITQEEMRQVSSGTFYITSKRIIFHGDSKNASIRFSSVISYVPYSDGIEIEKTSGRNPIFRFNDGEYASVLLGALLARD